ncbi:TetR family transcriptional regulator [Pullulanibacillus camelliae]|uniref:TetR family transcriptional regulator n=1 Tax=Pullulanibacillus camelliae TaxID=1707096 RepID=A0A8J2VMD4_9BACL|nr:TetR/AcrR family transcriptional regulator [Pullulanibacillus camelliae]GGE31069.1 TetR family transcriptional regulator [Pullulanibacillus camelliae]
MARNKEYDEGAVLDKAMKLFWEQGYEKTSMADLVEHMGIHRRSIYDAFTDKHTLFLKVMDRFGEKVRADVQAGIKQAETAEGAIEFIFDYILDGEEGMPPGCLFVNSVVELAIRDADVDLKTRHAFIRSEQLIEEVVRRGQESGEFNKQHSAAHFAEYLNNVLTGLRVMIRTSLDKEKLQRISKLSISVLKK